MAKTPTVTLTKLLIQGRDMEWIATYKYLGVIVARNNTSRLNVTSEINYLRHCRLKGWEQQAVLSSAYTRVRSLVDYVSPVFLNVTITNAKALETIQSGALRAVFGAPRWTKTAHIRTQVPTLTERIKHTTANFIIKDFISETTIPITSTQHYNAIMYKGVQRKNKQQQS